MSQQTTTRPNTTLPLPCSPLNDENLAPTTDSARRRQIKMQRLKLAGRKIPGVFTHKSKVVEGDSTLVEIVNASLIYQQSLKQWNDDLEQRVEQLTIRNDMLLQQNQHLRKKTKKMKDRLIELEYENELLRSRPVNNTDGILSYLSKDNMMEIVQQPEEFELEGLEGTGIYMRCWSDNNSNVRAFYLSMLQYPETRFKLQKLMEELQMDDTYKVLPLLDTNQFWMQISENFVEILDRGQFEHLEELYEYLNRCILLDLIFVSALRSRVEFLGENNSYDSPIESLQLYTVMANNFGMKVSQQVSTNYEVYKFEGEGYEFAIWVTDRNYYLVKFEELRRSLQCSEYQLSGFEVQDCEQNLLSKSKSKGSKSKSHSRMQHPVSRLQSRNQSIAEDSQDMNMMNSFSQGSIVM